MELYSKILIVYPLVSSSLIGQRMRCAPPPLPRIPNVTSLYEDFMSPQCVKSEGTILYYNTPPYPTSALL